MKFTYAPEARPFPEYTIKRGIHRGGFGEVYYALSDAGKEVALKLLQQNMEVELRGVAQCLNLKHPNLVNIFDVRTDADGDHWVIMEYVAGKSLDGVLREYPQGMPLAELRGWLRGIVAGIGFLHDRGIVHRDLKPANIYRENGVVKIGDVGLCKFISQSRRSAQTQSVGTVYYMAPEVAHGRYGAEVDVYSLGVILYEMLTGKVPFDGETTGEILMKHLSETPDLRPIPERLRPVLARALEKDPQRRTATVEQLERDVMIALGERPAAEELRPDAFVNTGPGYSAEPRQTHPQPAAAAAAVDARAYHRMQQITQPGPAPRAEPTRTPWYTEHAFLLKLAVAAIVILAVVSPSTLGGIARLVVVVGVYGALGYGAYRLVKFMIPAPAGPSYAVPQMGPSRDHGRAEHLYAAAAVAQAPPVAVRGPAPVQPASRSRANYPTLDTPRSIPVRRRVAELASSLTYSVFCAAIITAGVGFFSEAFSMTDGQLDPGKLALFGMATLLGAWAVLIPSKWWEGGGPDSGSRRLVLLGSGALAGLAVYWLDQVLLVRIPYDQFGPRPFVTSVGKHALIEGGTQPTPLGYVTFFALLLALRQWWRHADVLRTRRFRVMSLLLTTMLGFLLSAVFAFPTVWGMTWAAAVSGVVQLAAVWVPPADRSELVESASQQV